jgi:hypothetical protein
VAVDPDLGHFGLGVVPRLQVMPMLRWKREVLGLAEGHGWSARPGHKIFVADQGAVLFEFPASWVVRPGPDFIEIWDREPPDADCVLAVSYMRLPDFDWSELPLSGLLAHGLEADDRERIDQGPVLEATRPGMELAWTEILVIDPKAKREARCRVCLARGSNIQSLISFDFWPEDTERFSPVWDVVVSSLELGLHIQDPTWGRQVPS